MRLKVKQLAVAIALLLASVNAMATDTLRCDDGLVERGDLAYQVVRDCGDPYWIDSWYEVNSVGLDGPVEFIAERQFEAWYYNFGSSRLVRRLLFENGRLIGVDALDYGLSRAQLRRGCDESDFNAGITAGELVLRCGEPSFRDQHYAARLIRGDIGESYRPIRIETWVYQLGRNRLPRILQIENGVVTRVELGERQ